MTRFFLAFLFVGFLTLTACRTAEVTSPGATPAATTTPATAASIPSGTTLQVQLDQPIGTDVSSSGDTFSASVVDAVVARDGSVAVPRGATLHGTVTGVQPSSNVGDQAAIRLDFDHLVVNGRQHAIDAQVIETDVQMDVDSPIGTETGIGAAAGAALGFILEGDLLSALVGGALGAGTGTAISLGTGDVDATLPVGTTMTVQTTSTVPLN